MAAKKRSPLERAREVLAQDRGQALVHLQAAGDKRTRALLEGTARDLELRLRATLAEGGAGADSFTARQLKATLAQVRESTKALNRGLRATLLGQAGPAAEGGADGTARYLAAADKAFRGVGTQPLALRPALMLEAARDGAESSVLSRIAEDPMHPGQPGVLVRYGVAVVGHFERELQKGILGRKSQAEMAEDLTARSPFLQGAPGYWATRIVRTEAHGAMNRGQWEASRAANRSLGDMVKIISGVFDDRTGADSYATHGQIRRLEEPFESWYGLFQHPPDRPNDRAVVVPHRLSWPRPAYLEWRDDGDIADRWAAEGRKGRMPPRPLMTTVPLNSFAGGDEEGQEGGDEGEPSESSSAS